MASTHEHRSRPLSSTSALMGALIGGGASLTAAVYTQRYQDRLQRVAVEVTKRETVYADFMMNASNLLVDAYVQDLTALSGNEHRIVGLINRMRLFASPDIIGEAEAVLKAIIQISLKPGVNVEQLAREALSKSHDPEPILKFAQICRADLDNVRRNLP